MKKLSKKILVPLLSLFLILILSSCDLSSLSFAAEGKPGLSAYELAVENGFEGTLEEWLESLKGETGRVGHKGQKGDPGEDGKDGKDGKDGLNYPGSLDAQMLSSFVVVTEYLQANTGEDLTDQIQGIINANPNRTIFFPDGEYIISKPLKTSAHYDRSVSLLLSNYAEIKASKSWQGKSSEAMIMLGAAEHYNSLNPGSNYFLEGGIINGSGVANGVSIDSGRETRVENVSIKNTIIGLRVKNGANSGSADADVTNVHITCNSSKNSIGLLIEAHDNTFENMRICNAKTGVLIRKGGNFLRDIHPLIGNVSGLYSGSIGFDVNGDNWLDNCYSDNFETAFRADEKESLFTNCYSFWWYTNSSHKDGYQIKKEIGFHFTGQCNSSIQNSRINFANSENTENAYMKVGISGGTGTVFNPRVSSKNENDTYLTYLIP